MPTCTARSARWCTAWPTTCWSASPLGGLNEPHSLFGKTVAQAYDTAAYKIAADDLLLSAGVEILFHALGAGVVMDGRARAGLLVETKSGRAPCAGRAFIDCSGDGDLAAWAGRRLRKRRRPRQHALSLDHVPLNGVDPQRAGEGLEVIPGLMARPRRRAATSFRARARSSAAKERHRVARQPDAAGQSAGQCHGRNRRGGTERGRGAGPAPDRRRRRLPQGSAGLRNSYIVDIAPQVGIRETRRVIGGYMLTNPTCWIAPTSTTPSASTAGRWSCT
jgi:hypothetical protein